MNNKERIRYYSKFFDVKFKNTIKKNNLCFKESCSTFDDTSEHVVDDKTKTVINFDKIKEMYCDTAIEFVGNVCLMSIDTLAYSKIEEKYYLIEFKSSKPHKNDLILKGIDSFFIAEHLSVYDNPQKIKENINYLCVIPSETENLDKVYSYVRERAKDRVNNCLPIPFLEGIFGDYKCISEIDFGKFYFCMF